MTSDYSIRNCSFAFKCDKSWEEMRFTGISNVRFCDSCQREVHYCLTDEQLSHAVRLNRCVAVDSMHELDDGDERSGVKKLLGVITTADRLKG